ncbi:MAG: DNA-binding protein WhiA [Clostridia bacterium]
MSFSSDIKAELLIKIDNLHKECCKKAETFGEYITEENVKSNIDNKYDIYFDISKLNECCIRAILMGSFLNSGYITNPNVDYHLEILFKNKALAEYLINLLSVLDFSPKLLKRKIGKSFIYVIYIKEAEQISIFLSLIAVDKFVLEFEEIRVEKDVKNNINRNINCETANLSKTIKAAVSQLDAINKIKLNGTYKNLNDKLKEVASLRETYKEETLEYLSKIIKISKSGLKHRLDKIIQIANDIK